MKKRITSKGHAVQRVLNKLFLGEMSWRSRTLRLPEEIFHFLPQVRRYFYEEFAQVVSPYLPENTWLRVKGIPKSIEKKKRQKSHHRNVSKSAIDHLFCQDHPGTFAEALHEQSFLRRVMADLGYHPTWDFYRLVLVPLWILDADSTKDQQRSRHEQAIDRVNLLNR